MTTTTKTTTRGDVVHVVLVTTTTAKRIKTMLEAHSLLHRRYRITPVVAVSDTDSTTISTDTSTTTDTNATTTTTDTTTDTTTTDTTTTDTTSTTNANTTIRPGNATDTNNMSGPCSLVAIPITSNTTNNTEQELETLVSNLLLQHHAATTTNHSDDIPTTTTLTTPPFHYYQFGHYFCHYSSRMMGACHPPAPRAADPSHHPPLHYYYSNATTVPSILLRAMVQFSRDCDALLPEPELIPPLLLYQDVTRRLQPCCPPKMEWFGDDRTIVLPRNVWRYEQEEDDVHDTTNRQVNRNNNNNNDEQDDNDHSRSTLSFRALLLRYGITAARSKQFLEDYLWTELARTYQSHRIVRRDEIHPDSPIRRSHYQILWYDPNYYSDCSTNHVDDDTALDHSEVRPHDIIPNNNNNTAPRKLPSCHWITVTEQGIRQSFDMTKVMFSRGNISEKIRYGTLVQTDDLVLDLYAGIGYFTLPALIHGHAKHVTCCEWNPDAIVALKYNLQDNHVVSDRVTIYPGDCRRTIQRDHPAVLQNRFDRICLGLLPSSEGGWSSAVLALRKDIGGWLHVHGNVPPHEMPQWSRWLSQSLRRLLLATTNSHHVGVTLDEECNVYNDWIILVVHVEKVKSFAPNVNHYVADVFIGPRLCFPGKNDWPVNLSRDCFQQWLVDHHQQPGCIAGVIHPDRQCTVELCTTTVITPPSCALSPDGPLHQTWMMDMMDDG